MTITETQLTKLATKERRLKAKHEAALRDRDDGIRQARREGMTHARIADAMDLSRGRPGQIPMLEEADATG